MAVDLLQTVAQHQGVRLADKICLFAGSNFDRCDQSAGGRGDPLFCGSGDIRVCTDQLGTLVDQLNGLFDFFKAVGSCFAYHHIIRIYIVHIDSLIVKGFSQGGFSDYVCGAAGRLRG